MSVEAMPPCLKAALDYLKRRWSAIPLSPPDARVTRPGKQPLISPWKQFQKRLPTEAEIRQWWRDCPRANVGVVMGTVSGIIGVDIDRQEGYEIIEKACDGVPETLAFSTPGGPDRWRLIFKLPAGLDLATRSIAPNGTEAVQLLSDGRQTVMPPSIHPNGGVYGAEVIDREPIQLPQQLIDLFTAKPYQGGGPRPTRPPGVRLAAVPVYDRARALRRHDRRRRRWRTRAQKGVLRCVRYDTQIRIDHRPSSGTASRARRLQRPLSTTVD